MNFGERIKSHAKTLAEAAKQFQSFDEMAAQDAYIHSSDLNVTTTVKNTVVSETPVPRTSELLDSLISPISINHVKYEPHRRPSGNIMTSLEYESDRESHRENESESHDPIMDNMLLTNERTLKKKSSDLISPQLEERKTASRFIDDLNDRLSKPNVDIEQGQSQTTTTITSTDSMINSTSVDESNNRWGWMKIAAASTMKDLMGESSKVVAFRSPLSRTTSNVTPQPKEEEFLVVQSSTILGEEEQAELDRIRMSSQGDPLTLILNVVKQHPQFTFIAFTLVLGSAMYFYSRFRGAEDDVN